MTVLRTADGHAVVPGNRWDLVDDWEPGQPRVTVVVPYYDAPEALSRLLEGVARQTYPPDLLDVVVADDGSSVQPELPPGMDITVVRQKDLGFRAAAARNLGVSAAAGEVICFLDQDMVPEPEYVERITRLVRIVPDALVVGRRRHRGAEDPAWLSEAYERTRNLLDADDESYRFVISAVMACSRRLFDELGGFDGTFTEYGGEDWEFAHRAWNAGAVFAHEPAAVAWHDGPDWGGRGTPESRAREKAAEERALAVRIDLSAPNTRAVRRAERWRPEFPGVDLVGTLFGPQEREVV